MVFNPRARTDFSSVTRCSIAHLRALPPDTVDSWQFYLVEVAHRLRRTVGTDPAKLRELTEPMHIATRVLPPVGNIQLAEAFLASMIYYGFSDEDATAIYLTFFTRILGVLCAQSASSAPPATTPKLVDVTAYPTLARLSPFLSRRSDRGDFDAAVDDIISSLERDLH